MYFIGSFVILSLVPQPTLMRVRTHLHAVTVASAIAVFAVGYFWEKLDLAGKMWNVIGSRIFEWNGLKVALLHWVSADGRFAIALVVLVGVFVGFWITHWRHNIVVIAVIVLPSFTLYGYIDNLRNDLTRERLNNELEFNLGSKEIQDVGLWLKNNSKPKALVATNHIVSSNGKEISDYSLAVWSDRTFLVLGPRFPNYSAVKDQAVRLSVSFADNPTRATCSSMSAKGVQWFVVDLRLTGTRSWKTCATTAYESKNFLVLRLTP